MRYLLGPSDSRRVQPCPQKVQVGMTAGSSRDQDIRQAVYEEFTWDPEIQQTDIGVAVKDGIVTLTGDVDSFFMKWMMERAAFRVAGVEGLINDIRVRAVPVITDADIEASVQSTLTADPQVPAGRIQVQVDRGVVTLTGEVDWQYQRSAAEHDAHRARGVRDVINRMTVRPREASVEKIRTGIGQALVRNAEAEAANIQVIVEGGGRITLRGTARSRTERQEAENAACHEPGVTAVSNEIRVEPKPSPTGAENVQQLPLHAGMTVIGSDNRQVGKIEEVRENAFLLSRPHERTITVLLTSIQAVRGDEVQLSLPAAQIDSIGQPGS